LFYFDLIPFPWKGRVQHAASEVVEAMPKSWSGFVDKIEARLVWCNVHITGGMMIVNYSLEIPQINHFIAYIMISVFVEDGIFLC
jgi:hypothetical protein